MNDSLEDQYHKLHEEQYKWAEWKAEQEIYLEEQIIYVNQCLDSISKRERMLLEAINQLELEAISLDRSEEVMNETIKSFEKQIYKLKHENSRLRKALRLKTKSLSVDHNAKCKKYSNQDSSSEVSYTSISKLSENESDLNENCREENNLSKRRSVTMKSQKKKKKNPRFQVKVDSPNKTRIRVVYDNNINSNDTSTALTDKPDHNSHHAEAFYSNQKEKQIGDAQKTNHTKKKMIDYDQSNHHQTASPSYRPSNYIKQSDEIPLLVPKKTYHDSSKVNQDPYMAQFDFLSESDSEIVDKPMPKVTDIIRGNLNSQIVEKKLENLINKKNL